MPWDSAVQGKRFGFISTRFAGTDGVSLESAKWAEILWRHQHISYWFAGKLDTNPEVSYLCPEAYFEHPDIREINSTIFDRHQRSKAISGKIHTLRNLLKKRIYEFLEKFSIDIVVAENCLTIPMNIPLGLALTEVIAETGIPTIAHHHDFYWERDRYVVNAVSDYLQMAFPPTLPSIQHVVINSAAR